MAAVAVPSNHCTSFPLAQMDLTHDAMVDKGDEGHSVDAPDLCPWDNALTELNGKGESALQISKATLKSPTESLSVESSTQELNELSDNKNSTSCQTGLPNVEERNRVISHSTKVDRESSTANLLLDVTKMRSKSTFLPSEPVSTDHNANPNVYWLNTEFDRLVSDKKKNMKTTEEMRKELKDIGLGGIALSSTKPKSVEDIMREYGLEPSISSSHSFNHLGGLKTAWGTKHKYGIVNMSQNNETLLASKSEIDDVKANGTSVDADFSYVMRRHGSNSSFVHATPSRENTNSYSESKHISRTPSFAFYDFKNSVSSTNLESSSSKANLDTKRFEDRTINPSVYFQRERERLQRIDSVINRTPRSSVTNIPTMNTWDSPDNTLSSWRRTVPSRQSSFLNMDQGRRFGDYGEAEKDWGNSSPVRAYLQQPSTITASSKRYSPLSHQFQSHENPVYRNSSNLSSTLPGRHYSRTTPSSGKEQRASVSKPTRTQSIPAKPVPKQSVLSDTRSSLKSTNKIQSESSSRGPKTSKTKLRQAKSITTPGTKAKSLAVVNKEDFVTKLMKNYSNSCIPVENEMGFASRANKDILNEWTESGSTLTGFDQIPTSTYCEPASSNRDGQKIGGGKYKPYKQNVLSMDKNFSMDEVNNTLTTSRNEVPTAWPASFDLKKYSLGDESFSSRSSESEPITSSFLMKNTKVDKSSVLNFDSYENDSFMSKYSSSNTYPDILSGNKPSSDLKRETSRISGHPRESSENATTDSLMDASAYNSNDFSLKNDQQKEKPKASKKNKTVPTKKSAKRK